MLLPSTSSRPPSAGSSLAAGSALGALPRSSSGIGRLWPSAGEVLAGS
ncbi:hypothetical protein DGo_CA0047 [Deinococcus gobiensis I-0]|uniref:Uncharacterized protein n=1 Tax=Deinococcus gobiensis (strain DSM 21396 / JCM 16679 / CGMCC 1.7299 / I-0) TaxID=745776 RepID=H8GS79_DEIGI|nr:hypothetical protein DGo_CA0047 [Deinococcus gobiensis I-0]